MGKSIFKIGREHVVVVVVVFFLKNTKVKLVELLLLIFTEIQKKCKMHVKDQGNGLSLIAVCLGVCIVHTSLEIECK